MRKKLSIIINLFVGIMSLGAWLFMAVFTNSTIALTSANFESLKYFTVLSNLFNGIVCLLYSYYQLFNKKITQKKKTLKLISTSAVGLTFLTVISFLGPLYGYKMMFSGSNFWFHLILPVLSFISFIFLEDGEMSFKKTFYSVIPTIIYSLGYVSNIILNGIGTWPNRNDFYFFLNWGYKVGAVISVSILTVTWIFSVCLYYLNKNTLKLRRKYENT